jgi:uncharacterized protein YegL
MNIREDKMFDSDKVQFDESNPERRCACVLLLDTSDSMNSGSPDKPIDALNVGLCTFEAALKDDTIITKRVEIAIVSFNSQVTVSSEFLEAGDFSAPTLLASGTTAMGAGIHKALDMIEARKDLYKVKEIDYFRPLLFMISDGMPTDDIDSAMSRIHDQESRKKILFQAIGVEGADMDLLAMLSEQKPLKLKGLAFNSLFQWLSNSISGIVQQKTDVLDQEPLFMS